MKKISILCLISVFILACHSEEDLIPYVQVGFTVNLDDPQMAPLQGIMNHVYLTGGYQGILLFRKSLNEFTAFERACPHDPNKGLLVVRKNTLIAVDSFGCKSEFSLIFDGNVSKGPSTKPLRKYQTKYYQMENRIYVTNDW